MDDNENQMQLIEELRTELAVQKVAMMAMLRIMEDLKPSAKINVANDIAEHADRVGPIDKEMSDALWDLSDEIRLRQ